MNYKLKKIVFLSSLIFFCTMNNRCKNEADWFSVEKIDNETFIIFESKSSQQNVSYLIVGSDKAILFDSGTGENISHDSLKISELVRKLTNVPIDLLLSHFHFDHTQNIHEFDKIAFPDLEILKNKISNDSIYHFSFSEVLSDFPKKVKLSKWLPVNEKIDLGSRIIEIIHTPGHSAESISIIDNDRKYLFTGDLLYNGLLLIDDINEYENSLKILIEKTNPDFKIFGAHGKPEMRYKRLSRAFDAIIHFQTDSFKAHSQIEFFGHQKNVYEYKGITAVKNYKEIFLKPSNE